MTVCHFQCYSYHTPIQSTIFLKTCFETLITRYGDFGKRDIHIFEIDFIREWCILMKSDA